LAGGQTALDGAGNTESFSEQVRAGAGYLRPSLDTDTLQEALDEVEVLVENNLPGVPLRFSLGEGVRVRCATSNFQSIVVNLLLAARDAVPEIDSARVHVFSERVDQSRASRLPGATAGSFAVVRAQVLASDRGPGASSLGGLKGVRLAVAKTGGFLVVEPMSGGVALSAFLPGGALEIPSNRPAKEPTSRLAVVLHPNAITRRTILAALAQMGFDCHAAESVGELKPGTLVFGDCAALDELEPGGELEVVELVQRGETGRTEFPALGVPFSVEELDRFVG
jgi:hypothetical protein